jgi:hypothetical protein
MGDRGAPEPTELIYQPAPSWAPALLAAGLAGVLAGLFTWWPYTIVGAIVAVIALRVWIADARTQFGRLPRRQGLTTAPIPPAAIRRTRAER